MKEAVLSIIGSKLISEDQMKMIKDLFKIMDASGNGTLEKDELITGFNQILSTKTGIEYTEDDMQAIIRNLKGDNTDQIDFKDFLVGCIRTDEKSFTGYMKKSYDSFFNNDNESIETPELIDTLCAEKVMKEDMLKQVAENIDSDNSQSITAYEFFTFVTDHLGLQESWAQPLKIREKLQADFPNIGQSGTFVDE